MSMYLKCTKTVINSKNIRKIADFGHSVTDRHVGQNCVEGGPSATAAPVPNTNIEHCTLMKK